MFTPEDIEALKQAEEKPYGEEDLQYHLFGRVTKDPGFFSAFTSSRQIAKAYDTFIPTTDQDIVDRGREGLIEQEKNTDRFIDLHPKQAAILQDVYYNWMTRNLDAKDVAEPPDFTKILPENVLGGYIVSHMPEEALREMGFGKNREIYNMFARDLSAKYNRTLSPKMIQALVFAKRIGDEAFYNAYRQDHQSLMWQISDAFLGQAGKILGDLQAGTMKEHLYVAAKDAALLYAYGETFGFAGGLLPEASLTGFGGKTGVDAAFHFLKGNANFAANKTIRNLIALTPIDALKTEIDNLFGRENDIFSTDAKVGFKDFAKEEIINAVMGTALEGAGSLIVKATENVARYNAQLYARYSKSTASDTVLSDIGKSEVFSEPYEPKPHAGIREDIEKGVKTDEIFEKYLKDNPHEDSILDASIQAFKFMSDYNVTAEEIGKDIGINIDRDFLERNFKFDAKDQNEALNYVFGLDIVNRAKQFDPNVDPSKPFSIINGLNVGAEAYSRNEKVIRSLVNMPEEYYKASLGDKTEWVSNLLKDPEATDRIFGRATVKLQEAIDAELAKKGLKTVPEDILRSDYIPQDWNTGKVNNRLDAFVNMAFPLLDQATMLRRKLVRQAKKGLPPDGVNELKKILKSRGTKLDRPIFRAVAENLDYYKNLLTEELSRAEDKNIAKRLQTMLKSIDNLIDERSKGYSVDDFYRTVGELGHKAIDEIGNDSGKLLPERHIHFDDAYRDEVLQLLSEYGELPIAMIPHRITNNLASTYAKLKYFGLPEEGKGFSQMADAQKGNVRKLLDLGDENRKSLNPVKLYKLRKFDNNIDYISNGGLQGFQSGFGIYPAFLGSLVTTTNLANLMKTILITDALSIATNRKLLNDGTMFDYLKYTGDYFNKAFRDAKLTPEEAETIIHGVESHTRNYMDIAKMQLQNNKQELSGLGKITAKQINNLQWFFEKITQNQKLTNNGQIIARRQLADLLTNPNDKLKARWASMFGVLDKDWEYLAENASRDSHGRVILSSIDDSYSGQRLLRAFDEETRFMVANHDQSFRAGIKRVNSPIGAADFMLRNMMYLKGIPFVEQKDKFRQLMYTNWEGRTAIIMSGLLNGLLITVIGNALVGRETDLDNPEQWREVLSRMPISGQSGDLLSLLVSGGYQSNQRIASLMFGQYDILREIATNDLHKIFSGDFHTHDFMRIQKKLNPIARMPGTSILWDRWISDNLIATYDPSGYKYLNRLNKLDDKRGNPRIFRK